MFIEFDICALIVLTIMFFSAAYRKMFTGDANRIFLIVLIISFISTLTEIGAVAPALGDVCMEMLCTLYYVLQNATLLVFLLYLIALTDGWEILKHRIYLAILLMPFAGICLLLFVINPIGKDVFSVQGGVYYYGSLKAFIYIFAAMYFLMDVIYIFKYRRFMAPGKIKTLFCITPVIIFALIFQAYYTDMLIVMFAEAMVIFFYSVTIQREEEIFYEGTAAKQRYCFIEDIRLAAFNKKPLTICLFKIKDFYDGIETVDYEEASRLIRSIALKIPKILHQNDARATVYYLGMGCFCVTFDKRYKGSASALAETIYYALSDIKARRNFVNANQEFFSCVFNMPEDAADYHSIQAVADNLEKLVPSTNKVYHVADMDSDFGFTFFSEIETIIDRAIKFKEFEVYYQPMYSSSQKRINSAEALLRLKDPKYGWINPEVIINVAEKNGSIHQLGKLVYEDVCRFVSSETFEKIGLDHVEVNLSVEQFKDRKLCDKLVRMINNYNIAPGKINFEITETAMTDSWEEVKQQIDALRECGFSLSLDDFGQKNSDLRRLSSLLFGIVKLDMEVVREMANRKGKIVLESIVGMLKNMDIHIVAEGVETREMAESLLGIGCDYLQGYYFSKPLPKEKFVEYVIKEGHRAI